MTTTNELLATLNAHRVKANKAPLKAWKESRLKLEAAIATFDLNAQLDAKFEAPQEEIAAQTTRQEIRKETLDHDALPEVKVVADKAKPAKRIVNVAAILKDMGFTTVAQLKVARAKLRRNKVAKNEKAIREFFKK